MVGAVVVFLLCSLACYFLMPVAEVATVRRGPAIYGVYGTVRMEPTFGDHVRAQNSGFAEIMSAARSRRKTSTRLDQG